MVHAHGTYHLSKTSRVNYSKELKLIGIFLTKYSWNVTRAGIRLNSEITRFFSLNSREVVNVMTHSAKKFDIFNDTLLERANENKLLLNQTFFCNSFAHSSGVITKCINLSKSHFWKFFKVYTVIIREMCIVLLENVRNKV